MGRERAAIHGRTNSTTILRCVHRAALTLITHLGFRAAGMHTRMFARIIGRLYMCPGITPPAWHDPLEIQSTSRPTDRTDKDLRRLFVARDPEIVLRSRVGFC